MDTKARMPSMEGQVPVARGNPRTGVRHRLRRYHRRLAVTMLTLYVMSGVLMVAPTEMKTAQAILHVAIGITHWLV
jgi:hypothetical protein